MVLVSAVDAFAIIATCYYAWAWTPSRASVVSSVKKGAYDHRIVTSLSRIPLKMVSQLDPIPATITGPATARNLLITQYSEIQVNSLKGIHLSDITKQVQDIVNESGVLEGQVNVLSRHTTTAITINEMEGRLVDDVRQYLLKLAPASYPYLHNDLHLRKGPPDWPGGDEAWRAQEPVNAHSHLLVMLLGTSETVPIHKGRLMLGTWQSLIMVELDGPRTRTVAVQVTGHS